MSDEENKMSEFELFYHSHPEQFKKMFGADFAERFANYIEFCKWWEGPYKEYIAEAKPKLFELAKKHYNDSKEITHPVQIKYIDRMCESNCSFMMFQMEKLCKEYKIKDDIHKRYPKLEEWRAFYCTPEKPKVAEEEYRKFYPHLSDEEWEKRQSEENRKLLLIHKWNEKRKGEYYEIVQPLLFKYLPVLNDIEGDYWVSYAVTIRDIYEEWKVMCERIEIVNDYDMPPENVNMDGADFQKAAYEYFTRYGRKRSAKRDERIYGEKELN